MASSVHLLDTDVDMSSPTLSTSVFLTPPEGASPQVSMTADRNYESDASGEVELELSPEDELQEKRKIQKAIFDE